MQTGREQKLPAAEWVALSALKTWKRNPRKNKEAISAVARSIESFGFGAPIVARREDNRIIAGHTRYEAAKRLAMETVPVRFLDVTEEQANALALADNKLGEIAEWDDDQLKMILAELRSHDAELPAIAGWSDEELAKLLDDAGPGGETTEDEVPLDKAEELREKWGTSLGQLWEIKGSGGMHRIVCGDSTDDAVFTLLMRGEKAVILNTDPPYGVDVVGGTRDPRDKKNFRSGSSIKNDGMSESDLERLLRSVFANTRKHLADGGAFYVWHPSSRCELFARCVTECLAPFRQVIVWVKSNFVFGRQDYHWQHEPCFYGWVEGTHTWIGSRNQGTTWTAPAVGADLEKKIHPTAKPVFLAAKAIQNHAIKGQLVLEPFSGSGSTLVACEQTGRVGRAIELEPKFVAVALERLSALGLSPKLCPAS